MRSCTPVFILCIVFLAGSAPAAETARQREQRSADQKQLELRMGEVTRKLDSGSDLFKNRGSGLNEKVAVPKEETVRELGRLQEEVRKRREIAGKKLSQLGSATGQEFDRLKAEINSSIQDLNDLYQRMSSLARAQ